MRRRHSLPTFEVDQVGHQIHTLEADALFIVKAILEYNSVIMGACFSLHCETENSFIINDLKNRKVCSFDNRLEAISYYILLETAPSIVNLWQKSINLLSQSLPSMDITFDDNDFI